MKDRILIIGSIASGKTTLARYLNSQYDLPVIFVDEIEFKSDLSKNNIEFVRNRIMDAMKQPRWILDGYGPLDLLPDHLKNSQVIIFLDLPLYLNIVLLIARQIKIIFRPRPELPKDAREWNWIHFRKMFQTLLKQHRLMNPELRRILEREENKAKLIHVQTFGQLRRMHHAPNIL